MINDSFNRSILKEKSSQRSFLAASYVGSALKENRTNSVAVWNFSLTIVSCEFATITLTDGRFFSSFFVGAGIKTFLRPSARFLGLIPPSKPASWPPPFVCPRPFFHSLAASIFVPFVPKSVLTGFGWVSGRNRAISSSRSLDGWTHEKFVAIVQPRSNSKIKFGPHSSY